MTILFRYMLGGLLKIFVLCLTGLMTVYLVVDFFEKFRRFIKYDAAGSDIALYFLFVTPHILFQLAPVAVLMATLLSLGLLVRQNEITALRSCGVSLFRMTLPFLCFAGLVAVGLFVLSAVVMPLSTLRAEYIKEVQIKKKNQTRTFKADRTWIQTGGRTLMNIEAIDPGGATLRGVRLYRLGPDFRLVQVTEAKDAHYTPQGWVLRGGTDRRLFPDGRVLAEPFGTKPLVLTQIPEDFETWISVESQELTLADLKSYADRLRRNGYNFSRFLTDYYGRWAFPFVSVVMALVGVALSLRRTGVRGGGITMGMGQALAISFLYWTTHSVAIQLGRGGVLMPILAGWFANLLFVSFGLYLLLRVRY